MKKARNEQSPTSLSVAISRPILIVRWIANTRERNEIAELHAGRRLDRAIGYVNARSRTDVIDAVERWLADDNAQILYIGAHGIPTGLVDGPHSQEEITWQSLGRTLAKRRQRFKKPILLMIGACHSSNAAKQWSESNFDVPVSLMVAFRERPLINDVIDAVHEFVESSGVQRRGGKLCWTDLMSTSDDAERLLRYFGSANLVAYHKLIQGSTRRYIEPSDFASIAGVTLDEYLEHRRKGNVTRQLAKDVDAGRHEPEKTSKELNRLRAAVKRSNKKILNSRPSSGGRPLPRRKISRHPRRTSA